MFQTTNQIDIFHILQIISLGSSHLQMCLNTLRDRQGPVAWRVEASEIRHTEKQRVFHVRFPREIHGKNYVRSMGKPWENHGFPMENTDVTWHNLLDNNV